MVELRDRHHADSLVPCGVGRVALIVEPVAANYADGVRCACHVVDYVLAVLGCEDVRTVDWLAAED